MSVFCASALVSWLVISDVSAGGQVSRPKYDFHGVIFYNEDDSHRFMLDPPGQMKPQRLDILVDELAESKVGVMLICCNAKKTAFDSKSWPPHCAGFDPSRGNDQPFFRGGGENENLRRWAHNQLVMFQMGVDPVGRMIDRCRTKRIAPWISIRMNDVHDADRLNSSLHSPFWLENQQYWRYPDRLSGPWMDRCLDYGYKPVRDYVMSLVKEVLNRYDMDGLELDWNRFPAYLRDEGISEKSKVLTEWVGQVRQAALAAEEKWGHLICLAARVPAWPEIASGIGLDAVDWAKRGLIDHLVVAPFWTTTDFDIPVERWVKLLEGTAVGVTAGLDSRVLAHPKAQKLANTAERRRGAAMNALARGSQGIYLFNYFNVGSEMPFLLNEMHSVEGLEGKDRTHTITWVDISAPALTIAPQLPRKIGSGQSADFKLYIGPAPRKAYAEVRIGTNPEGIVHLYVNGHETTSTDKMGVFYMEESAFANGYNTIEVANSSETPIRVELVELAIRFGR